MGDPARILVVDDEENVALTLGEVLKREGYHVHIAASPSEANALISKEEFDVALVDLRLGTSNGIDIIKTLRSQQPACVTIILTGYASLESAIEAIRQGAYDYLVKPCDLDELKLTVKGAVERGEMVRSALRGLDGEVPALIRYLRRSKDQLYAILQGITEGIIVRDADGKLVYANDAASKMLGYPSQQELLEAAPEENLFSKVYVMDEVGQPLPSYALPWKLPLTAKSLPMTILRFRTRSTDEERVVMVNVTPICDEDGRPILEVSTLADITERKHMEEALRESEERYRTLFEQSTDVIFIVNNRGEILDVNEAILQVFGYSREEVIGTNLERLCLHPGDSRKLLEVIELNGFVRQREMTFRGRNGEEIDCLVSATVRVTSQGTVVGYQAIVHDITERKRAQERENQARLQFLNFLAHELRNPLVPLLTSAGMLQETMKASPESTQGMLLSNIQAGVKILSERIDELVDIAAFHAGKFLLRFENFPARKAIEEVCDYLLPEAAKKRQHLSLDIPPKLPNLKADKRRLQQVLSNLLLNAIKFSPEDKPITVRARVQDKSLLVQVEDNGPGISKEEQARLFQPYFRVPQESQRFPGLGLGLALCRQIVEAHGGKIWVESEVDKGSTFSFSLPLLDEKDSPKASKSGSDKEP